MSKMFTAIGLMSGTSMDGVDAAIVTTDGATIDNMGEFVTVPYDNSLRENLKRLVATKRNHEDVENDITVTHAKAVEMLLDKSKMSKDDIDIIGFHGHTIDHQPKQGFTWQIGDGALLAKLSGIDVVNDFRTADMKEGGQGAPLVPLFHRALVKEIPKPVAILNVGGVANVTYLGDRDIIAFDTGTGIALLDDWIFKNTGENFDKGGNISGSGKINEEILQDLISDPFFSYPPPKSLDRNHFSAEIISSLSFEDGAATLSAFSAEAVALGQKFSPEAPLNWYVTGGGRLNKRIMAELAQRLSGKVDKIEALSFSGDALEAQAFAYFAVRSVRKLPLTLPSTTGVRKSSVTGGVFYPA